MDNYLVYNFSWMKIKIILFRFEGDLTEENLLDFMEKYLIDKEKEKEYENKESEHEL